MKTQETSPGDSDRGRRNVILVKCSQSLLDDKGLLPAGKDLTRALLVAEPWGKGIPESSPLWSPVWGPEKLYKKKHV